MFSIYRSQTALAPLKEVWESADPTLQETLVQASRRLDQQLQGQPQEQGESRVGSTRIIFEGPLGALYRVDEERRLVRVLKTWVHGAWARRRLQGE
jgi:hypothetical protein